MAKALLTTGKFTYDVAGAGTEYAVVSMNLDQNYGEVNVTDTGTTGTAEEYLGGRVDTSFSFTIIKDVAAADIAMNTTEDMQLNFQGVTYTGDAILLTKNVTAQVDGRVEQTYTGRFTGTVTQANS